MHSLKPLACILIITLLSSLSAAYAEVEDAVGRCDALAANPIHPRNNGLGVKWQDVNVPLTIEVCQKSC